MGPAYLAREVGSGIAGSFLALAYCFSYAALIFSGPLAPFVPLGVAMALIACIATTVPVALFSRFTPSVSSPVSHTAAPLAAMTAFMAPALALYAPDEAFILGVGALLATTLLTGAVLLGLGLFRLAASCVSCLSRSSPGFWRRPAG